MQAVSLIGQYLDFLLYKINNANHMQQHRKDGTYCAVTEETAHLTTRKRNALKEAYDLYTSRQTD
jgi:hypothetical protein